MSNRILIAGHSQVKYFEQYLKMTNVDVVSFPGYRIEQMWGVIGHRVGSYKTIVLHIGANNLWNEEPPVILQHYQTLVGSVQRINPRYNTLLTN